MEQMIWTKRAKKVFTDEIDAITKIRDSLSYSDNFNQAIKSILDCKGRVVLSGMGKSGHIAKKIAATFSSLGIPAFFLHPAEAMHGDLGMVTGGDVVILISHSGESREIVNIIPGLKALGATTILITGNPASSAASACDYRIILEVKNEACALNLAPTSSTTAALVLGDALAVVCSEELGFTASEFGLRHPAGSLGKIVLTRARDLMAKEEDVPKVIIGSKITEAIMEMSKKGLGVVAVVDNKDILEGLLTDGDLRRAIEKKTDFYNGTVDTIMTENPKSIKEDILVVDALTQLKESHLNNYPVVDDSNHVIGMLTWQMIVREGIML